MCKWEKLYKKNGVERKRAHVFIVFLCCRNWIDCVLLVRVGIPSLRKEWKVFLVRQAWSYCNMVLVLGPFAAQGVKGEEEYP
jgi:hypothetical protein